MVGSLKNVDVIRQSQKPERSNKIFEGTNESLAASLHRGLQIIDYHKRNSTPSRSSVSFSFEHLALKPCLKAERPMPQFRPQINHLVPFLFELDVKGDSNEADKAKGVEKDLVLAIERDTELKSICKDQAAQIEHLNRKLEQCTCQIDRKNQLPSINEDELDKSDSKPLFTWDIDKHHELPPELIKEKCEIKEVQNSSFCTSSAPPIRRSSSGKLRYSLLSQSILIRKSSINSKEEFEREREKWMEMESGWISLTDELRIEIESNRRRAEKAEDELTLEKKSMEELDDALGRSVVGQARMIEHYTELQEKYNELVEKHRGLMEAVADVKRAASKAAGSRHGACFVKALSAELSHREASFRISKTIHYYYYLSQLGSLLSFPQPDKNLPSIMYSLSSILQLHQIDEGFSAEHLLSSKTKSNCGGVFEILKNRIRGLKKRTRS